MGLIQSLVKGICGLWCVVTTGVGAVTKVTKTIVGFGTNLLGTVTGNPPNRGSTEPPGSTALQDSCTSCEQILYIIIIIVLVIIGLIIFSFIVKFFSNIKACHDMCTCCCHHESDHDDKHIIMVYNPEDIPHEKSKKPEKIESDDETDSDIDSDDEEAKKSVEKKII